MNEKGTHPLSLYFQLRNIQYGKSRRDTQRLQERRQEVSQREQTDLYWSPGLRYRVVDLQRYLDELLLIQDEKSDLAFLAILGLNELLEETIIAVEQHAVVLIHEWNNNLDRRVHTNKMLKDIGRELMDLFDIEQRKDQFIRSRRN